LSKKRNLQYNINPKKRKRKGEKMKMEKIINMETQEEYKLIREGEAVLSVILHRELGMSVVETEMMLEPYLKD
jgi:hypothetical protein